MVDLELIGLSIEAPSTTPIVLLRETTGEGRILPIFIGGTEAAAIAMAIEHMDAPRPMTHDLFATTLATIGAQLQRVVLTELIDGTYYARLEVEGPDDVYEISCRPSDGIALAVRLDAPIVATETLLDEAGHVPVLDDASEEKEVLDAFHEFIDQVDPEDFA